MNGQPIPDDVLSRIQELARDLAAVYGTDHTIEQVVEWLVNQFVETGSGRVS